MVDGTSFFSSDYREARGRFLAACAHAGAAVESLRHPGRGPQGEELALDAAWLGPPGADRVLVTVSATHGIEGYCGSAAQLGWLESGLHRQMPEGVALMMVHALNPHGFAWSRRVNEQNVDLNRNFLDYAAPLPENPHYDDLADTICPSCVDEETIAATQRALEDYERRHGEEAFLRAVVLGQYRHPRGLYYGGLEKSWSNRTFVSLLRGRLAAVRQLAMIDVHTGYGPYGYGDAMSSHDFGEAGDQRVRDWYGGEASTIGDGDRVFPNNYGDLYNALREAVPGAAHASICLEFGTRPEWDVFNAMRRENWVHLTGAQDSGEGREIKAVFRDVFYPEEEAWKRKVWDRAAEIQSMALAGLADS